MMNQVELDERDMFSLSDSEKNQKAKEFAEGNVWLEELLLFLWNHNATTYACCAGHESEIIEEDGELFETSSNPYILVGIENMTDSELQTILAMLCYNKDIILLEVNSDKREITGSRPRKYIDIQLRDVKSSIQDIAAIFYSAMEGFYFLGKDDVLDGDKEFIESAIALKNVDVEKIDLSSFKKYYKHFPESVTSVIITRNEGDNPKYEVKLQDKHVLFFDEDGLSYVCSKAYYRSSSRKTYVVDENAEIVPISSEQIKKLGLIENKEYISMIHEFFEKDQNALMSLLNSNPEKEFKAQEK